jgi:hypothetical protein
MAMTEKDLVIQEQRRTIKQLNEELRDAKAMLHRLSKFVPDEVLAHIALEMSSTEKKKDKVDEEFWRGE